MKTLLRKAFTMKKYNLEPYYTTFKIALYMAEERYKEYMASHKVCDTNVDDLARKGKEKELYDFLNSLDYEVIKALQVIMYIGRDSACIEKDGTYNYEKSRERFDFQGWDNDKSIEVSQMVQKPQLNEYLKNGFEKLNIIL